MIAKTPVLFGMRRAQPRRGVPAAAKPLEDGVDGAAAPGKRVAKEGRATTRCC